MNKKITLIFILFAVIGIILIAFAAKLFTSQAAFIKTAATTTAEVIELIPRRNSEDGSYTYAPRVTYTINNNEFDYISSNSTNPASFAVGEIVEIYYDPKNPHHAEINKGIEIYMGPIIVGGIGIVFAAVGIISFTANKKRKQKIDRLMQQGHGIEASIVNVVQNRNYTMNNIHPFVIHAQALHPQTNTMQIYTSENIWFDPTPFSPIGKKITVYIDTQNDKDYYVDTSFLPTQS